MKSEMTLLTAIDFNLEDKDFQSVLEEARAGALNKIVLSFS
jgi:hypothetical protein